jgi:hypothetical protein
VWFLAIVLWTLCNPASVQAKDRHAQQPRIVCAPVTAIPRIPPANRLPVSKRTASNLSAVPFVMLTHKFENCLQFGPR